MHAIKPAYKICGGPSRIRHVPWRPAGPGRCFGRAPDDPSARSRNGLILPVTIAIAGLPAVLVFSYRQVIAAFPDGGGAYGVAKARLGRPASLVAAASLVCDYVLNVAVSVAAGVAALTSAFPELLPYAVWLCLGVLAVVTLVNLRGVAHSARAFIVPTVVYVAASAPAQQETLPTVGSCCCSRPSRTAVRPSAASRRSPTPCRASAGLGCRGRSGPSRPSG